MRHARAAVPSALLILTLQTLGCGNGSPSSPDPVTTAPEGFVFEYDAAVSSETRVTIERASRIAKSYFQSQFGDTLRNTVTVIVHAAQGTVTAFAQPNMVTVNTLRDDWTQTGGTTHTKILVHELFHVFQYDVNWLPTLRDDRSWLLEGSAEYIGYGAVIDNGLMTMDEVRRCETEKYFAFGGAALPGLESWSGNYAEAWLAVDHLVAPRGGVSIFSRFWRASGDWRQAFQTAFGLTPADYTTDFAQFRQTLASSGSVCPNFER